MTTSPDPTLAGQVLANGTDDWVSAAEVYGIAVEFTALTAPEDRRDLALGAIARLVLAGLVVPGDVTDAGHVPWTCSPEEAVVRIVRDWSAREDPMVMPGEIVWLANTPAGDDLGEAVLARTANQA